jgi:ferredoxin
VSGRASRRSPARAVRVLASAAVLVAAVFGVLGAGEAADASGRLVSSWQLFPATAGALHAALEAIPTAALGAAIAALCIALPLLVLSAIFGRWYCAALCPLGGVQDLASWLGRRNMRYRNGASASRIIAAIAALCLVLVGAMSIASWLDPWSLFGRFISYDIQPLFLLAARADVPGIGAWTAAAAAAMAAILAMAVFRGRWFCGALCPIGSLLGLLNRAAPFRLRMESSACVSCGNCAAACPASCIDPSRKRIDESRCVYCLACVGACPTRAVRYGRKRLAPASLRENAPLALGPRMTRSGFLAALGGGTAALALAAMPGRAFAASLSPPLRATTPPGSRSFERFLDTCTACGLCAARCPSKVLQPSLGQLGLGGLFVPRLDYTISYCQFECTTCLDICPSGALERLPLERKKLTKIGDASLVKDRCIVFTNKTKCGACAERCPTGAVRMIDAPTGIPEPVFTSSICIGCGACHHACPVRPTRAINVSGLAVHEAAAKPSADLFAAPAKGKTVPSTGGSDFPF